MEFVVRVIMPALERQAGEALNKSRDTDDPGMTEQAWKKAESLGGELSGYVLDFRRETIRKKRVCGASGRWILRMSAPFLVWEAHYRDARDYRLEICS